MRIFPEDAYLNPFENLGRKLRFFFDGNFPPLEKKEKTSSRTLLLEKIQLTIDFTIYREDATIFTLLFAIWFVMIRAKGLRETNRFYKWSTIFLPNTIAFLFSTAFHQVILQHLKFFYIEFQVLNQAKVMVNFCSLLSIFTI